jgi:hypothetical protein
VEEVERREEIDNANNLEVGEVDRIVVAVE